MTDLLADRRLLRVAETFGNTWQGEGPAIGRRAFFIRLGLCNLDCTWCDTPYTWDSTRYDLTDTCPPRETSAIVEEAIGDGANVIVLTGGEPLLHQNNPEYELLVHELASRRRQVHVETNGTIVPKENCEHCHDEQASFPVAWYSVSVKLGNSGVALKKRLKNQAIEAFAQLAADGRAGFKFVCRNTADVLEAAGIAHAFHLDPEWVWIMPEGTNVGEVVRHHRAVADATLAYGFNTTTRLHTLLWNDERGH